MNEVMIYQIVLVGLIALLGGIGMYVGWRQKWHHKYIIPKFESVVDWLLVDNRAAWFNLAVAWIGMILAIIFQSVGIQAVLVGVIFVTLGLFSVKFLDFNQSWMVVVAGLIEALGWIITGDYHKISALAFFTGSILSFIFYYRNQQEQEFSLPNWFPEYDEEDEDILADESNDDVFFDDEIDIFEHISVEGLLLGASNRQRVVDSLKRSGYWTIADIQQASDEELLRVQYVGQATLDKIRVEIARMTDLKVRLDNVQTRLTDEMIINIILLGKTLAELIADMDHLPEHIEGLNARNLERVKTALMEADAYDPSAQPIAPDLDEDEVAEEVLVDEGDSETPAPTKPEKKIRTDARKKLSREKFAKRWLGRHWKRNLVVYIIFLILVFVPVPAEWSQGFIAVRGIAAGLLFISFLLPKVIWRGSKAVIRRINWGLAVLVAIIVALVVLIGFMAIYDTSGVPVAQSYDINQRATINAYVLSQLEATTTPQTEMVLPQSGVIAEATAVPTEALPTTIPSPTAISLVPPSPEPTEAPAYPVPVFIVETEAGEQIAQFEATTSVIPLTVQRGQQFTIKVDTVNQWWSVIKWGPNSANRYDEGIPFDGQVEELEIRFYTSGNNSADPNAAALVITFDFQYQ